MENRGLRMREGAYHFRLTIDDLRFGVRSDAQALRLHFPRQASLDKLGTGGTGGTGGTSRTGRAGGRGQTRAGNSLKALKVCWNPPQ
jgi:hypothetical protein